MIWTFAEIVVFVLMAAAGIVLIVRRWKKNDYGDFWPLLALMGICVVTFGICAGLIVPAYSNSQCHQLGEEANLPVRFNIYNGCIIKTEHGWLPQPQYIQLTQTNAPSN